VKEYSFLQLHVSNVPFPVGFGIRLINRLRDEVIRPTVLDYPLPLKDVGELRHYVLTPKSMVARNTRRRKLRVPGEEGM
jgi:hypothetical protein